MDALPYYKWLWRDWRANRRVQRMSWQARGLYRELLDEFWAEGSIPEGATALAEICGCTEAEMQTYWPEIEPCWERVDDGWRNDKMDALRTGKDAERIRKAQAGRTGGLVSNSRTRAEDTEAIAEQVQASAKELQAQPDIAEQSRAIAEHTHKQEQIPAQTAVAVNAERGKVVGTMPVIAPKGEIEIYEADEREWQETYPAIDVRQKLKEIKQWCRDSPRRQKTRTGIRKFINGWLARAHDDAERAGNEAIRQQGNGGHTGRATSPAAERAAESSANISRGFNFLRGGQPRAPDAANEGPLSEPNAPRGHAGDVRGAVGGAGDEVRDDGFRGRIIEGNSREPFLP